MYGKLSFWLMLLSFIALSCSTNEFKTHKSGLKYKFVEEYKNHVQPELLDVVALKMKISTPSGIQIDETPVFKIQLKKASHKNGSIEDAIALMHKKDSAIFKINTQYYYQYTKNEPVPENLSGINELIFYIKIIDIIPKKEFEKDRELARISNKRNEEQQLKDYLQQNNITVDPLMNGMYFIETKTGIGDFPTPGKKVTVHYTGMFLNGKVFDSSYKRKESFEFYLGVGKVIQGWDEGVARMKVGGKYMLIIPSYLAYGDSQVGPIPPNSILIFEIELLNTEK